MFTFACFYLQEKEGCHSSLYTLKWFMQCFLDRVCSVTAVMFRWCACIVVRDPTFAKKNVAWNLELWKRDLLLLKECFKGIRFMMSQNNQTVSVMLVYQPNPV